MEGDDGVSDLEGVLKVLKGLETDIALILRDGSELLIDHIAAKLVILRRRRERRRSRRRR